MTNATTPARGKRERKYSLRGRVRSSLRCALTRSRLYQFRVVNLALLSFRVLEMKIICTYFIPFTERLNTYVVNAHISLAIMNRIEFGRTKTATHSQSNNNNKQYQIRNRKFMPRNGKTLGKINERSHSHEYYIWRRLLVKSCVFDDDASTQCYGSCRRRRRHNWSSSGKMHINSHSQFMALNCRLVYE